MRRNRDMNFDQNNPNYNYPPPMPEGQYSQQPNQYQQPSGQYGMDPYIHQQMMQQQMMQQQMMQQQMMHQQQMQNQMMQQQMQQQMMQQQIQNQNQNFGNQSQQQSLSEIEAKIKIQKNLRMFINERNWSVIKMILWLVILLGALGGTGLFAYCTIKPETSNIIPGFSPYYLIPFGILDLLALIFFSLAARKISHWNHIIRSVNNGSTQLNATNFIKGFFKSSIKWNVSINWLCGYIYFLWLVAILFAFVSSYFTGVYIFGGKTAPEFGTLDWSKIPPPVGTEFTPVELIFSKLPIYTLIFGAAVVIFMIIVQIINIAVFNTRKKSLNNFYGDLFTYETYSAIVSKANKVNFIIYSILTFVFIISLVLFISFSKKVFKKK